jgi:hypothetical protein
MMQWQVVARREGEPTVYELRLRSYRLVVHRLLSLDGWYCSCREAGFKDVKLKGQPPELRLDGKEYGIDDMKQEAVFLLSRKIVAKIEEASEILELLLSRPEPGSPVEQDRAARSSEDP